MPACQCENESHFTQPTPDHVYGIEVERVADFHTEGAGTFGYCTACVVNRHLVPGSTYLGVRS